MAELVKCLECGKLLSSRVSCCPHCNGAFPHGLLCEVCQTVAKYSEMVRMKKVSAYEQYHFFHQHCLDVVLATDARCETCKQPLTPLLTAQCRNCGEPHRASNCYYCGQFVHPKATNFRQWLEYDYSRNSVGELQWEGVYMKPAHAICCAIGDRQEHQATKQARANEWSAKRREEETQQAEGVTRHKRVKGEKARRVKNNLCPVCGKAVRLQRQRSFIEQLFNNLNRPSQMEYDFDLGEKCPVHQDCLNKDFRA